MIVSRGVSLFRGALSTFNRRKVVKQCTRNSSHVWNYRSGPGEPSKKALYTAEFLGAFMWWWILWHLWTEPEHLYGEFPYPDPLKWTDEELGIPPDDENLGLIGTEE